MNALVTGGGGFLGRAIVEQLLARGDTVTSLARGAYPEIAALGASTIQADICGDRDELARALDGVDVVFHVAAKAGIWGDESIYLRINVDGTNNLMAAAKQAGVERFVFTSSPSAVFGRREITGLTEAQCPYPETFEAPYAKSKALSEQAVLAENGPAFVTTALRPQLIWGPRDPHIVPRLIDRRKAGRLVQVGPGRNRVAITYVDNAAHAHLLAADALAPGAACAGKAYFISDPEPVVLWPWINSVLEAVGVGRAPRTVSLGTARGVAGLMELAWTVLPLKDEPPMTRFAVEKLARSCWYDLSAARDDLGYRPLVDPDEGFRRMVEWFKRG